MVEYRSKEEITNDPLTEKIIAACFKVHTALGPGLKEKMYENALKIALDQAALRHSAEKSYVVKFDNKRIGILRIDLVVDDNVIVEIKAVSGIVPKIFEHQILSYLKISGLQIGLLVNFGEKSCQVRRFIN
jgi:GxxExxY protein